MSFFALVLAMSIRSLLVSAWREKKEKEKSQYLFTNHTSTQVDLGDESVAHYKHHTHAYTVLYTGTLIWAYDYNLGIQETDMSSTATWVKLSQNNSDRG